MATMATVIADLYTPTGWRVEGVPVEWDSARDQYTIRGEAVDAVRPDHAAPPKWAGMSVKVAPSFADSMQAAMAATADDFRKQIARQMSGTNTEGDHMNDDQCATPESYKASIKRHRKAIKGLKKARKAAKAAQAEHDATLARRRAEREAAREGLLRVVNDPTKGYAAVEAARELLNNYNL